MRLNFKTHFPWNGRDGKPEPTFFRDKILLALDQHPEPEATSLFLDPDKKLHTIRRINGKPRYREGMKLTLCTGSRFKSEPFAETVCTGTQSVWMRPRVIIDGCRLDLSVDGRHLDSHRMSVLALNDGLDTQSFFKWFLLDVITNGPGEYQLVHWGDVRY